MKIKIILLLLALCLVAPMIIPGPDGKPVMSLDDWKVDTAELSNISNKAKNLAGSASAMLEDTANIDLGSDSSNGGTSGNVLHKWQDSEGNWHFSDKAPEGTNTRNLSVEKMPEIQNTLAELESTKAATNTRNTANVDGAPTGKVTDIVSDAQKVKAMAEQRNQHLESY